jgi:hypothetical protein
LLYIKPNSDFFAYLGFPLKGYFTNSFNRSGEIAEIFILELAFK